MEKRSTSLRETEEIARQFITGLAPTPSGRAVVVGLSGELGSGKTTFVQAAAKALGVKDQLTSPTFVIEKVYQLPRAAKFKHLIHIDCYRLERPEELAQLGWPELVSDPGNLILVEWPEKVSALLPPDQLKVYFEFINETTRKIKT